MRVNYGIGICGDRKKIQASIKPWHATLSEIKHHILLNFENWDD
jgi:hypothetical protein